MNVLVWFKRDLRVHDHPALTLAAGLGRVLPLYIAEPDTLGSARSLGPTMGVHREDACRPAR